MIVRQLGVQVKGGWSAIGRRLAACGCRMGRGRKTAPPIKEDHHGRHIPQHHASLAGPASQGPWRLHRTGHPNNQEKGGILPDFTLDEAEETHLFARVAQALSKTLTRQGLTVRHEAKAAAEPMGYRLDEHAIAIDTRRPWKDIALDLAHALGAIQVARDALNPADQPQGAAEWNRYKDKGRMVGDQLLASIGLLNSHWHENRGVIRAHALQARVMAEPDLHAPLGVYDWNAAWITGEIATRNPDPAQPLAVQPIRIPATKPEDIHLALPDDPANPLQVTDHPIITPHDDLVETTGRHLILGAGMPTMLIVDMDRSDAAGLDLVRRAATRESTFQGSVSECIRQAQATAPGYDPAPDEGPTGLWPAANMFPDPAVLPGAMPMETPDRPGPAQDAGMDGPAIGA